MPRKPEAETLLGGGKQRGLSAIKKLCRQQGEKFEKKEKKKQK